MNHCSIIALNRVVLAFLMILISVHCKEINKENLKGHLQPIFTFGNRKEIVKFEGFPSPLNFFRDFVSEEQPVLLQNAAKTFPAFKKWSDEYFLSFPESKQFQVGVETLKKENRSQPTDEVAFSIFLNHYSKKDIYMVDSIPPFLRKDVLIPSCLNCQDITKENMLSAMMWMSNGGTKSVLHNDHAQNINCVFKGTKTFYLVDSKYMDNVNVTELGYSDVDVESVDLNKYPGLYNIEHYKVTMQTGDCLYIPFLWVHQVTSYDNNIAVNFWWKNNIDVNFAHCTPATTMTVDDIHFVGLDSQLEAQHSMIRGRLLRRIRLNGPMTFEDLVSVIRKEVAEIDDRDDDPNIHQKMRQDLKMVFRLLDSFPTDGIITKEDVRHVPKDDMESIRKYITSVIELQQQRIERMEKLMEEEQDGIPSSIQGETPVPVTNDKRVDQTPDSMDERMDLSDKKLHNNGQQKVNSLDDQWTEMVKKRKLSLERQEEL